MQAAGGTRGASDVRLGWRGIPEGRQGWLGSRWPGVEQMQGRRNQVCPPAPEPGACRAATRAATTTVTW